MRGEFIGIWSELTREVWDALAQLDDVPTDLYCELFRELQPALKAPLNHAALAEVVSNIELGRNHFYNVSASEIANELSLIGFLEKVHDLLADLSGEALSNAYFNILESVIVRFSLRYELRRPCTICPTISGIFSGLMCELKNVAKHDPPLSALLAEYESSVRDIRYGFTSARAKVCIQKHINLLEGLAMNHPDVTKNDLGSMCKELRTWPHRAIRAVVTNLYQFACDYPGIRHGGSAEHAIRNIEMKDMIAISILLAGCVPYLSNQIDDNTVYSSAQANHSA